MLITAPVVDRHQITPHLFMLSVAWNGALRPGQFFMLHSPSQAHILPRPISVFDYNAETGVLSFLIGIYGEGTRLIGEMQRGDMLTLFGPLGNGFPQNIKAQSILLIGGMEGIAPMLLAFKELKYHNTLRLFAGFKTREDSRVLKYFNAYQDELDIRHTTEEDGALVTSLLEGAPQPQTVFLCGSAGMMKSCVKAMALWKSTNIYLSLDAHMACGVGACAGCTVKGRKGKPLRPCSEGPVFEAKEVF